MRAVHDLALVTHHDRTGANHFALFMLEFVRPRNGIIAVIPDHLHRAAIPLGRKFISDLCALGIKLFVLHRVITFRVRLDRGGHPKVKRPVGRVKHMTNPVANAAAAKRGITAPVKRQISRVIGALGGGAKPLIPVQPLGHLVLLGLQGTLFANLAVDILEGIAPRMHLGDLPNRARPDQFTKKADMIRGMPLVADLRDYLFLQGSRAQRPHLGDRMCQRLLRVNMFAAPDRPHDGDCVRVIRRRHQHGVDLVADGIVHLPKILEALGLREFLERPGGTPVVHIAQRHDVLPGHRAEVGSSAPATADGGNANLVVGSVLPFGCPQHMAGHNLKSECSRG